MFFSHFKVICFVWVKVLFDQVCYPKLNLLSLKLSQLKPIWIHHFFLLLLLLVITQFSEFKPPHSTCCDHFNPVQSVLSLPSVFSHKDSAVLDDCLLKQFISTFLVVVGQVQSWLYTEAQVLVRTWPNIKKVTTVTVQDGLLECGMLCSSTEDCALFHLSDGTLCVLAKVAELVILSNVRFIHHQHSINIQNN